MDFCPHTWHKGTFRSQNITDTHVHGENAHRHEPPPWRIRPQELLSGKKNPASYDLGFFRHGCGRCLSPSLAGSWAFSVAGGMPVAFSTAWSSVNRTLVASGATRPVCKHCVHLPRGSISVPQFPRL